MTLFRIFGNGTSQLDEGSPEDMMYLAGQDTDYYQSRGGLVYAAVLHIQDDIPTASTLKGFKYNRGYERQAIEAAQEVY